jgi:hypothetical protein
LGPDQPKLIQSNLFQLSNFWISGGGRTTSEHGFRGIGQCRQLERLDIYIARVSEHDLAEIFSLPRLKALKIRLCPDVSGETFARLFETASCKEVSLMAVRFDQTVDDRCLRIVGGQCPDLEALSVNADARSNRITFEGVRWLVERCRKLWCLQIYGLDLDSFPSRVKNELSKDFVIVNHFMDGYIRFQKRATMTVAACKK